jgi:hypothetical protein
VLSVLLRRFDQSLHVTGDDGVQHDLVLGLQDPLPAPVQAVGRSVALGRLSRAGEQAEQSGHVAGDEEPRGNDGRCR